MTLREIISKYEIDKNKKEMIMIMIPNNIKENVRDCSISTVISSDVDYPAFDDIITV